MSSSGPRVVQLLIQHGADANARDRGHSTPLHLALSWRSAETVQLLVKHGADVNARDASHKTPLHLTLSLVSAKAVILLMQHWVDEGDRTTARCHGQIRTSCSY